MTDIKITPSPYGTWECIPSGGMSLTAEQVEDVRTYIDCAAKCGVGSDNGVAARLHALFPATEPAEDSVGDPLQAWKDFLKPKPIGWYRTMELDFAAKHFGFPSNPVFEDRYTAPDGGKWQWTDELQWELRCYPPAPVEPAEEETKAVHNAAVERRTVLGRRVQGLHDQAADGCDGTFFHDLGRALEDFLPTWGWVWADDLSPVVPAPTETGPWQHRDGRICVYAPAVTPRLRYRVGKFNDHGDFVHDDSERQLPEGFAPFVAAEEG